MVLNREDFYSEKLMRVFLFLLMCFCLCFSPLLRTQTDTFAAKKYPLNDPRNPNCPCHVYQKMAEKEYKKEQIVLNEKSEVQTEPKEGDENVSSKARRKIIKRKRVKHQPILKITFRVRKTTADDCFDF